MEKYKDLVFRLAFSYCGNSTDADDIFQEVFLRYYHKKPQFESEEHEKAWFIRVSINCSKSLLTTPWRTQTVELDENIPFQDSYESDLFRAILELPPKYRAVIELYYYEGYKIREIAKLLHRSENAIKQRLSRARKQLKKTLSEERGFKKGDFSHEYKTEGQRNSQCI